MHAQQGHATKAAVSVSKHAARGLTKSLAKEFGRKGVTTNITSPGTIVGDAIYPGHVDHMGTLLKNNPSGRLGRREDIACVVGLPVSKEGGLINGQLLQVNAGVVTWSAKNVVTIALWFDAAVEPIRSLLDRQEEFPTVPKRV